MIESEIIPYYSVDPIGERILILAPHPDDETLGCAGTIKILLEMGKYVRVLFLTSGDKGEPQNELSNIIVDKLRPHVTQYAIMREKEAVEALSFLGVSEYEFLRYPDREVGNNKEKIYSEVLERIKRFNIDTVYSPSPIELNPDHRATAEICMNLISNIKLKLVFYEITIPIRPNVLVDITKFIDKKEIAIRKYKSQLSVLDYAEHIMALNKIRSLTVKGSKYAEAFWFVDKYLDRVDLLNWLGYQSKL